MPAKGGTLSPRRPAVRAGRCGQLLAVVLEVCDEDTAAADAPADTVEATAHGYAKLLIDGEYGDGPDAVNAAVASAQALTAGRHALRPA